MSVKVQKKIIKDDNLIEMFNQMLGGDGDETIIAVKKVKLREAVKVVIDTLDSFVNGPFEKHFTEYKDWCEEIRKFIVSCKPVVELDDYKAMKDHDAVKNIILMCRFIIQYRNFILAGDDMWIRKHPGDEFVPFKFTKLDLKHIWNNSKTSVSIRKYCIAVIKILFKQSEEVYQITTTPDIDVSKFSSIIVESIDKIRGVPQLSRCRKAFDKIAESVDLLKDNFTTYYRDMVQAKSPNVIIENFVYDVSKTGKMDAELLRQFREIIKFYKAQSSGKIKDPKVQKLFDSLNDKMKLAGESVVDEEK